MFGNICTKSRDYSILHKKVKTILMIDILHRKTIVIFSYIGFLDEEVLNGSF